MKKAILILLAVVLLAQIAVVLAERQVFAYQGEVAFFEENGLMGLQDKAGKVLHKAEFVSAEPFDVNNLAHVYLADGSQGFIDRTGNWVIEPMQVYYLGYVALTNDTILLERLVYEEPEGKEGLLSLTGEVLLPAEYDGLYPFSKEKIFIRSGREFYLADNQGRQLYDLVFDGIDLDNMFGTVENEDEIRYYNSNGVCIYQESPEGIQYTDEKGKVIDVSAWDRLYIREDYQRGYILGNKRLSAGIMDIAGNTVIKPIWGSVNWRNNNYFTMRDAYGNTYSYNIKTKERKKLKVENGSKIEAFEENCILYVNKKNKYWGYMDYEGNILSKVSDEYNIDILAEKRMYEGYIFAKKDNQIYFFDAYGNSVTSKDWEKTWPFNKGYAAVRINGKWGFINTKGEVVVEPVWDDVTRFSSYYGPTVAEVSKDGRPYGWINKKSELLSLDSWLISD